MHHPGLPPHAPSRQEDQERVAPTPDELRQIIAAAGITQAVAAEYSGCKPRAMRQWLAADRAMPIANAELLCLAIVAHRHLEPGDWMTQWVRPALAAMARRGVRR